MSNRMSSKFDAFMRNRLACNGKSSTNTRIGDTDKKIYGGNYHVPDSDYDEFIQTYFDKVFKDGCLEYMTEKQLIENGPMLVDIDMQYNTKITTRQHNKDYILDLVSLYLDKLSAYLDVDDDTVMNIFVLEKKNVNILTDKTKDGIHIIFGLQVHKAVQVMIRNDIVYEIANIWDDLPIENSWDQVVDEGVAKGHVNWQLYGSRKPGHESYLISTHYTSVYAHGEWGDPISKDDIFDTKTYISQLSARYTGHPRSKIKVDHIERFEQESKSLDKRGRKKSDGNESKDLNNASLILTTGRFNKINSEEMLDDVITCMTDQASAVDYRLRETHDFTLALTTEYYGPGSYNKWIRVGWALANTSPKMFVSWLKLSCQDGCRNTLRGSTSKFDWNISVDYMFNLWKQFDCHNPDGLSHRSIMYWCKRDNFKKYEDIRKSTIDYFIDQTVVDKTEFDLASVLFNIFKDRFVCVSIKNNCWYEYKNHRWFEIDSGTTLRLCISKDMHYEYLNRIHNLTTLMQTMEQSDSQYEALRKKTSTLASIAVELKKTVWKNNIMREARELFYDKDFFAKLDENPYLLCFGNGVVDFKQKIFRPGQPDDYMSKCTNIDFVRLNSNHDSMKSDINKFLDELFPNNELRRYMFDHLASVLIGTLDNQTFNIYTGSGRNGKSCLVDLMSKVLGDYKGTVPSTLITQKRTTIGGTSSEIVQLMGTRYAVMQEPSKGDKINEGIMKEITGGDPIQGRALFKDTVTFIPQFKLVVTTNVLFDIKSNDDGTWRRIRVCDFESKFLDKPYEDDFHFPREQFPHQYPLDKKLNENFNEWAPVFASMLVERAFDTQGNVKDCNVVLSSSIDYREGQDYLAEFVREKITMSDGKNIKKQEIMHTFREWYQTNYGRNIPKARELYEFMDRRYGNYKGGWHNIKLIYDEDDEDYN